mmetsp:Transcript_56726/g.164540  ORF Transcript_56726/g.164540 Transcript_56726/m.164540 type:complete len:697 (-) Transcript_56726:61-2151(-)
MKDEKDEEKQKMKQAAELFKQGQAHLKKVQHLQGDEAAAAEYEACVQLLSDAIALRPQHVQYYQTRGRCFKELKQYQRALDDFSICIRFDPENARHYHQRGLCYRKLERVEEALKDYNDALKRDKDQGEGSQRQVAEYHFERALVFIDLGMYDDAIAGFGQALDKRIQHPYKAHLHRGICYRKVGKVSESIDNLKQAINIDPTNADAHNHLGLSYVEQENFHEAKRYFFSAIEHHACARYYNNRGLACYHIAASGGPAQQYEEALQDFTSALEMEPNNASFSFNRGNALFQLGRHSEAFEDYSHASDLDPENATYLHHKGLALQGCGEVHRAIDMYEQALQRDEGHHASRFHLGLMYHVDGQFDRALEALSHGLPEDEALHEARGLVYRDMGDLDRALADFSAVIELEPDQGQHRYNRGVVYHRMSREEDAIDDLTRAIELGSVGAAVYSERGLAWRALGNMAQATNDLTAAIEADSMQTSYLSHRAQCLFEQGLYDLAEADLSRALQLDGSDPALLYKRGITCYAQRRYSEAIADLKAALQDEPPKGREGDIYYHLGVSYANLGKQALAVPCFDEACSRSPEKPHYYHERAKSLQAIGDHARALKDFTLVIEMQPRNARAMFRRAFSYKAMGAYEDAAEDFEAAKEYAPDDPRLVVNYRKASSVQAISLGPCGHEDPYPAAPAVLGPREALVKPH